MGWQRLETPDEYACDTCGGNETDPWYPTIEELLEFLEENEIPRIARLRYAGCGSHTIALEWDE